MDSNRTERQKGLVLDWFSAKMKGVVLAATGFGKSRVGLLAIKRAIKVKELKSCLIIVPSIGLKIQWEKLVAEAGINIVDVMVINTAANRAENLKYELVIYDEFHRAGSEFFIKALEIKKKYILGLTATLERPDNTHLELVKIAPVIGEVKLDECLIKGWVSNYRILNLIVPFTKKERAAHETAVGTYEYYNKLCTGNGRYAFENARSWIKGSEPTLKRQAAKYYNALRTKNDLAKYNVNKIAVIEDIVNNNFRDRKGFIFSTSIEFATDLQGLIDKKSIMYHSKLKKKEKEKAVKMFISGKKTVCNAVQSMNEGLDFPDASLAIILDSDSSVRKARQQLGRIIRATEDPDKVATLINVCSEDSVENGWADKKFQGLKTKTVTIDKLKLILNE